MKNPCFFVNTSDTWILLDFHENSRVLGVNEKPVIFDHFRKGYIIKNGGFLFGHFWASFGGSTYRDMTPEPVPEWGRGVPFRDPEGPAVIGNFCPHRQTQ